ncbi:MAG TPA: hypothetical protein VMR98_01535 [Candidatus Polarisedimenticolaceae bacterium]|nr:hypothetical protein [Candidatus Polarisedimenticolaceae bacterium]
MPLAREPEESAYVVTTEMAERHLPVVSPAHKLLTFLSKADGADKEDQAAQVGSQRRGAKADRAAPALSARVPKIPETAAKGEGVVKEAWAASVAKVVKGHLEVRVVLST